MDELDFKGGLVGDFKRSLSSSGKVNLLVKDESDPETRPYISKSPSNSSFGFENTFRVLESQVSGGDGDQSQQQPHQPPIVTTLELELGAVARLQQLNYYSTPVKGSNELSTGGATPTQVSLRSSRPLHQQLVPPPPTGDCDKYLEFLNQFIKKSRQKDKGVGEVGSGASAAEGDKVSITVGGCEEDNDNNNEADDGLVEFGEYPELVYCIAKDKSGRYRLQNKDRIKSPQRTSNEGKQGRPEVVVKNL